ncbi:MAG: 16S rRNA (guanine(527)-N(7))-methyltransferase RsmG [Proteobacteria bacterium]|nr:16S rRNA (guanine(527)-N(7))-methyltransferase RsmG [Pseudomonadota bacterium]
MEKTFLHTLSEGAAQIGIRLGKAELDLLAAYHRELLIWNRRINLVSDRSSREIVIRHFIDSLTLAPWISRPDGLLIDIGSGAGFPGIPLRIALPGLQLWLVEASRKKTSFLSHLVRTLRLDQVTVVRERIEALIGEKACAGRFDTVLSRAAFKLPELVRMASFFLAPGGLLIAMKGPDPREELEAAERVLTAAGMAYAASRDVSLPGINLSRKIIIYRRVSR